MLFKRKAFNLMMSLALIAKLHKFISLLSDPLQKLHYKDIMELFLCMVKQPLVKPILCWVPKTSQVFCHALSETFSMALKM